MSNWKNVNNWHWVNKNCLSWAKTYFNEQLVGLEASKDEASVKIVSVDECTGDCDLNQRKGKIITIYDLVLKLTFEGQLAEGTQVKGSISVPEVAHDFDEDDYVFDIKIDNETSETQALKPMIRKQLTPAIVKVFGSFANDMIKKHAPDVYIDPAELGTPAAPREAVPTQAAGASA
ncbi:activator of Hsp90 ATPase [Syncephalastrum racemosum]|uniref:Activator of Hsp90 ATPase n=1 Tax=Syncephalastrum racemosum TaxID=13706 RepID=A0A1X2H096_SYNRA|nr:activator of Hsp90 ATPase [Syncephalastrum racemosum]